MTAAGAPATAVAGVYRARPTSLAIARTPLACVSRAFREPRPLADEPATAAATRAALLALAPAVAGVRGSAATALQCCRWGGGRAVFVLLPWLSSTRVTQYLGPRTVGPHAWAPCLSALRAVDALERHYRKSDVKALDHQLKEGGPGRSRFLARHGLTWIPRGALAKP